MKRDSVRETSAMGRIAFEKSKMTREDVIQAQLLFERTVLKHYGDAVQDTKTPYLDYLGKDFAPLAPMEVTHG